MLAKETGIDTVLSTVNGVATVYLAATDAPGKLSVTVESGTANGKGVIPVRPSELRYLGGRVVSDTGAAVEGVLITLEKSAPVPAIDTLDITPPDGRYIALGVLPDFSVVRAERAGYFVKKEVVQPVEPVTLHDISLVPLADGKLFGKTYVLDARYGGAQTGDVAGMERSSDINLAVARRLHELLVAMGANARLMRQGDEQIPESERARRSVAFPRGLYIRIDASSATQRLACEMYPNAANRIIGSTLLAGVASSTGLDTIAAAGSADQFYRDVAMSTVSLVIPSVTTGHYSTLAAQRVDAIAWGIVKGILDLEGYHPLSVAKFQVGAATGSPLAGLPVVLDETLTRYTDAGGTVNFLGLEKPGFVITTPANPEAVVTLE
ncbi:hypothetical protein EHM92_06260 [bacterium]|nr:MAG: hypothetical protein EHM92_06260 [bacterium]